MRGAPYHLPGLPGPVSGKLPSSPHRVPVGMLVLVAPCPRSLLLNFAYLEHATAAVTRRRRQARGRNLLGVWTPLTEVLPGAGDHPHNILSSSSSRSSHQSPMLSLLPTPASAPMSDTHPIYGYQAPNGSSVALSGDDARYGFLAAPAIPMSVPTTPSIRMEEYIAYYFKHVRELQFVFFGEALANILYPVSTITLSVARAIAVPRPSGVVCVVRTLLLVPWLAVGFRTQRAEAVAPDRQCRRQAPQRSRKRFRLRSVLRWSRSHDVDGISRQGLPVSITPARTHR